MPVRIFLSPMSAIDCERPGCRSTIGIRECAYEVAGSKGGTGLFLAGRFCSTHQRGLPVWRWLTPEEARTAKRIYEPEPVESEWDS